MNDVFGKKLGHYILLEQLGEGGMARVYNALDSRAERNVAIKVILPGKRTSPAFLQQFEQEAKILANLTHTNIVKVLDYGVQDGQPYLVMEYIPGGSLREAINQKLPWQTAAALLAPIARALDYVHHQQIVHRDVKPSNILLQDDFRPMLADFGIMKLLEGKDEKSESAIGAGVGTPEYMPPEQGLGHDVDFRADIYALGLVFYEMVTGQKPFTADTPMAVVIKHVTDRLPLPSRIDKNIPRFVELAIMRALQKDPKKRYINMGHFADTLELIALGDKAPERKIIKVSRQKEKRKKSIPVKYLLTLLGMLALGTAITTYMYFNPTATVTETPSVATSTLTATIMPETKSPPQSPAPTAVPVSTSVPSANPLSAITLLGTPPVITGGSFKEVARWGIGGVNVVRWSPDGSRIALGTSSGIFIYDATTKDKKLLLFIDTQFNVLALAFHPVRDELVAGSPTGIVKSWNAATGESIKAFEYRKPKSETIKPVGAVSAISFNLEGTYFAVGYANGAINYFSDSDGSSPLQVENYPMVTDLVIAGDDRLIYAGNGGNDIQVWNIQTKEKYKILSNSMSVNNLDLSADRQFLLAGGGGMSVNLWDITDQRATTPIGSFPNLGSKATDFDFSFDDKYVAIGLANGDIKIFGMPSPQDKSNFLAPLKSFHAHDSPILSLSFAPGQQVIASGNIEEGLKIWNGESSDNLFPLGQSSRRIKEIYISNDGNWIATSHDGGLVRVWSVPEAREVKQFEGYLSKGAPFSPDSRFLAFIYSPGKNRPEIIRIVDLSRMEVVADLSNYIQRAFVQFTEDSKLLVMGDPYSANIWDVATWEKLDTYGGPTAGCGQYFTPKPQSELLAVISRAGIQFTYETVDREMCGTAVSGALFKYFFRQQNRMIFVREDGRLWKGNSSSMDLSSIASAGSYPSSDEIFLAGDQASGWYAYVANGRLYIENIKNSPSGVQIDGQLDYRYRVAFLPDRHLMALGSRYGSIHLWSMP